MRDQKPTGVFVRLPNDAADPQWAKAYAAVVGDEGTKKAALWDFIQIVKAIGTPVTGGDLPTAVFRARVHSEDNSYGWSYLKAPPSDQDASEYELEVERLLTHEQAVALIAARDAEIARLRYAITVIDKLIMGNFDPIAMFCGIHANCTEALKGGAA